MILIVTHSSAKARKIESDANREDLRARCVFDGRLGIRADMIFVTAACQRQRRHYPRQYDREIRDFRNALKPNGIWID